MKANRVDFGHSNYRGHSRNY